MKNFLNQFFMPLRLIGGEIRLFIAKTAIAFKSGAPSVTSDNDVANLIHTPLLLPFWIHPCTQHNHSNTKLKIHGLHKLIHTFCQGFPSICAIISDG